MSPPALEGDRGVKEAWRDPAGDGAGLVGQAISRAIAGERGCFVCPPRTPSNPIPPFSPLPQVMGSRGTLHRERPGAPATDGHMPPYLGERFEPQCCDNCPCGCTHIGCPQLAARAEGDTDEPGSPHPTTTPEEGTACPSIVGGHLGSSPSSTTNPNSPTGVYLWLHQVSIIPSHKPPLFKKLFKALLPGIFGCPGQRSAYLGVMGASPLRLV